jgi:hypothetical protein
VVYHNVIVGEGREGGGMKLKIFCSKFAEAENTELLEASTNSLYST